MLNHAVYGELRERLLNGRYAAGARLPTEELRTEFGVSKQPVMEALRRLSADGMVEIVPQVGSLVAIHEPRETDDCYLMFSGFEEAVAGIAAQGRTDIQLAELDLISLRNFLINTSDAPPPLSSALDGRHDDHARIRAALHAGDQDTARVERERHVVGTSVVMQAGPDPQRGG